MLAMVCQRILHVCPSVTLRQFFSMSGMYSATVSSTELSCPMGSSMSASTTGL